ncbi:MAG: hypothetical protein HYV07_02630 [Deltaproteobacteria bacterium]|nr:hypothetical protein [Deltaproteobacteria bacterium]
MSIGSIRSVLLAAALVAVSGCACDESPPGAGRATRTRLDAGVKDGAEAGVKDGAEASTADASDSSFDSGTPDDSGTSDDSGMGRTDFGPLTADSGTSLDASGPDAWPPDFGSLDAAEPDASAPDAAAPDAAAPDAAAPDAGQPGTGDPWLEIDYSSANSPRSPSWSFSATPGWGPSEWAAENANGPEAWDRWNNMQVVDDPVGRSLEIGSSSELQLMLGFEEMISIGGTFVSLEGRSRATSSSVRFAVYNPLTGCGGEATMSNDWTADVVVVDLTGCFLTGPGAGVQAVRVEPLNGTVALIRMRVSLVEARW